MQCKYPDALSPEVENPVQVGVMGEEEWILWRGEDVQHVPHGRGTRRKSIVDILHCPVSPGPYMHSCVKDALLVESRPAPTATVTASYNECIALQ